MPPTEKRGRVHTSTVTVSVLDEARTSSACRDTDFSYRWFSGTGKGGQHRNKCQNCLEITHIPSGLKQIATGRSRETNEREAKSALLRKLDELHALSGHVARNEIRSGQIGCGMRGDKRRTYRFQEDSVTDHETGKRMTCKTFMRGDIEKLWPSK